MDVCCLNRPFDNQSQDRVYHEAEAVLTILSHCYSGEWTLVSSDIIEYELSRLANSAKLQKIRSIYSVATEKIPVTSNVKTLSRSFQRDSLKLMDSLHLALCEAHGINFLLTTDDKLIKAAAKLVINTRVINPVAWLMEVTKNER